MKQIDNLTIFALYFELFMKSFRLNLFGNSLMK